MRAEIVGAFFNAIFLIALCLSIVLESITRFIDPPEIQNPKLILIVGSFGLASNFVGFFVLGGHGHRDHRAHEDVVRSAEEGRYGTLGNAADDEGPAADVLPEVAIARATDHPRPRRICFSQTRDIDSHADLPDSSDRMLSPQARGRHRSGSGRNARLHSIDDIAIHPASFRQDIIAVTRSQQEAFCGSSSGNSAIEDDDEVSPQTEESPLLSKSDSHLHPHVQQSRVRSPSRLSHGESGLHDSHNHKKPKKTKKGRQGHDHGDIGMNAMILHVIGDALGNVGVIATALIMWLSDWEWRYYADPTVSLIITVIILRSCLPLTMATSKILLQATPDDLNVTEVREDIESLPGVVSCHHIHVWQLSDTQLVASMHIHVEFPISEAGGDKYMQLSRRVRNCLHEHGIHSATIQPEFCSDRSHASNPSSATSDSWSPESAENGLVEVPQQKRGCCPAGAGLCLLDCIDDCKMQGCCKLAAEIEASTQNGHDYSHGEHDR